MRLRYACASRQLRTEKHYCVFQALYKVCYADSYTMAPINSCILQNAHSNMVTFTVYINCNTHTALYGDTYYLNKLCYAHIDIKTHTIYTGYIHKLYDAHSCMETPTIYSI